MRRLALVLALVACSGSAPAGRGTTDDITYHSALTDFDEHKPTYGKAELQQALIAERAAEASAERKVNELADGDYDQLRVAKADLAVRQRFLATLEICEAAGRVCPPRLDEPTWSYALDSDVDPKLDTPLRFDLTSWQKVSAELHGRACACRTLACVDSVGIAIDRLETRPMADVQGDETAWVSITRARECLFRLRGKRALPRVTAD